MARRRSVSSSVPKLGPGRRMQVKLVGRDRAVAYVYLPGHHRKDEGGTGTRSKTVNLDDLIEYVGPRVHLDFDSSKRLIGIEIIVFGSNVV